MSKFKVGDKVAPKGKPYLLFGQVIAELFERWYTIMGRDGDWGVMPEDDLILYQEIPDMTNNEIYYMLKPKLEKAEVIKNKYNMTTVNVNEAVGLAYRSGYLRAKKGRPFKIGGEKE